MKKFKILFFVVLFSLSFSLVSCGDVIDQVIDKVCQVSINAVKKEYTELINNVKNDPNLTDEQKREEIARLETERDVNIEDIKVNC